MLVLTRRNGEKIVIHDDAEIIHLEVVALGNGRVKLGLIAPARWKIKRDELLSEPGNEKIAERVREARAA